MEDDDYTNLLGHWRPHRTQMSLKLLRHSMRSWQVGDPCIARAADCWNQAAKALLGSQGMERQSLRVHAVFGAPQVNNMVWSGDAGKSGYEVSSSVNKAWTSWFRKYNLTWCVRCWLIIQLGDEIHWTDRKAFNIKWHLIENHGSLHGAWHVSRMFRQIFHQIKICVSKLQQKTFAGSHDVRRPLWWTIPTGVIPSRDLVGCKKTTYSYR